MVVARQAQVKVQTHLQPKLQLVLIRRVQLLLRLKSQRPSRHRQPRVLPTMVLALYPHDN